MLNLPNFLTLIRILTIPVFLVLLSADQYWEALIVFVIGAITDFLDGWTARWMNQQTALGTYLDPAADKLLVISSFVMLALQGAIPSWLALVVVSRDVLIVVGYGMIYVLLEERLQVRPSAVGKASTLLQLITLAVVLAMLHRPGIIDASLIAMLVGATALATVLSGLQYLYRGLVWLQTRASELKRLG